MNQPPLKTSLLRSSALPGKKTVFFLIALAVLLGVGFPAVRAQGPGSSGVAVNNGQSGGNEEDLSDFFLETVEGVEASGFNAPAVPPLPPSSNAAQSPPGLPPTIEPTKTSVTQFFPPSIPDSSDIAAPSPGWTPLAMPENKSGTEDKVEPSLAGDPPRPREPLAYDPAKPFNSPSAQAEPQPFQHKTGSAIPLDQGRVPSAIPPPFWEDLSSGDCCPPPESAGNWIQLEVGQSDGVSAAPTVSARPRPASVSVSPPSQLRRELSQAAGPETFPSDARDSAVDRVMNHAIMEPTASTWVLEPAEREHLRKLFSDISPAAAHQTIRVMSAAPANPALDIGFSAISLAGRLLSEHQEKAVTQVTATRPEPELKNAAVVSSSRSLDKMPLKNVEVPAKVSGYAAGKMVEASESVEMEIAVAASDVEQSQSLSKVVETARSKPKQTPAKTKAAAKSAPLASTKPAPSKNSFSLIVINETGRDRVAQQYGSVLKRLGYNVSSEVEGKASKIGPAGRTIISYRPGFKSQARSVSRYLPGKKILLESRANQVLASEIVIYIR